MDDGVQAMLDQLNAGFPRVESMTGAQARAAVAARRMPVTNSDDVASAADRSVPGPDGDIGLFHGFMTIQSFGPAASARRLVCADLRRLLRSSSGAST
ncbi:hypothetical protein AWC05_02935 [Mycobacterium florentinum]|uniref:Uncharacterized protein n=2 Tax=Mycobacterium florentinum TaxID=292462 RepID=A0A1X1TX22_MYCFL|nr:hypothetical protein [Mycobacterium florentinum]ORV49132.1 hypothetical protein AWC05_02935 [Mycobacterium florentinum]BBX76985.1 hypothetical protein MFLOJ_07720 [Mycobacterium florentinum]